MKNLRPATSLVAAASTRLRPFTCLASDAGVPALCNAKSAREGALAACHGGLTPAVQVATVPAMASARGQVTRSPSLCAHSFPLPELCDVLLAVFTHLPPAGALPLFWFKVVLESAVWDVNVEHCACNGDAEASCVSGA